MVKERQRGTLSIGIPTVYDFVRSVMISSLSLSIDDDDDLRT
jgi:hypothetical protein